MRSVAICIGGLLKSLPDVARSIHENLVEPLDADLFVNGPLLGSEAWLPALAHFPNLAEARLVRENVTQFLKAESGENWRAAAAIKGNWLGCIEGEVEDMKRTGAGLCLMFAHRQCLEMVSNYERQRGRQYERLIYSRADMRWLAPHPPLSLLPVGDDEIYIVDGEDNGGINDRHWVMPRHLASEMLGAWYKLLDGSIARFFAIQGMSELWAEPFVHFRMVSSGLNLKVRRFPGLGYILCESHNKRKMIDTTATGLNDSRRLDRVNIKCAKGQMKYPVEYGRAHAVATCLGGRPWSWGTLWECWCEEKASHNMLQFLDYALCVRTRMTLDGYRGPLLMSHHHDQEYIVNP